MDNVSIKHPETSAGMKHIKNLTHLMFQSAEGTSAEGIRALVRPSHDLVVEWRGWVGGRAGYGPFHGGTYFVTVHGGGDGVRWNRVQGKYS